MFGIDQFLLLVALPVVVAASLIEALRLARRGGYDWRATGVSLLHLPRARSPRAGIDMTAPCPAPDARC